jgi:hypothetical protein
MAFGQQSGPSATARQLQELLELLQAAGYASFREARGPMGFNQRQGGGRFTRDEAEALIASLQDAPTDQDRPEPPPRVPTRSSRPAGAPATDRLIRSVPSERLAEELRSRGWLVVEPLAGPEDGDTSPGMDQRPEAAGR